MITNLSDEYTLGGFIDHKSTEEFSYKNFSVLAACESGEVLFTIKNVVDDYIDELLELSTEVHLSDEERRKYEYRPWLLAYDVYGNSELYWIIMLLNDIPTPNEFENIQILKMPKKAVLEEALSKIMESESAYLSRNRSEMENI